VNINAGSVETMVIEVNDQLGTVPQLPPGTTYDIKDTDGNIEVANQVAVVDGMTAQCLIDATNLTIDDYELFLKFTVGADTPILGPFLFRVK
jgi:hypothetical protein